MKKSIKKLTLSKMTITNLSHTAMNQMVGGRKSSNSPTFCTETGGSGVICGSDPYHSRTC